MADTSLNYDQADAWVEAVEALNSRIGKVMKAIKDVVKKCEEKMDDAEYFKKYFRNMAVGLGNAFDKLVETFQAVIEALKNALKEIFDGLKRIGETIMEGVGKIRNK